MFGKSKAEISVEQLKERIDNDKDILMIDIRRPGEWVQTGVIENSKLITDQKLLKDIDNGKLSEEIKGKDVILICRSGNRSGRMTSFFRDHRNISAINMKGGIIAWKKNGFPVISPME